MFVASSCEPLPDLFKLCLWRPKMAWTQMSHVSFVEVMLSPLFIAALWSPAWKGLTSWLLFVMSNCDFVTFP